MQANKERAHTKEHEYRLRYQDHWRSSVLPLLFLIILCIAAIVYTRLLDSSSIAQNYAEHHPTFTGMTFPKYHSREYTKNTTQSEELPVKKIEIPLNCTARNSKRTCPANYYPSQLLVQNQNLASGPPQPTCPDYFRWIHEDLWPWRETGITLEMLSMARETAHFRLVIVNGRAYVEKFRRAHHSRDTLTLWGILQVLRRYPGQLPDLDLMFDCNDRPAIMKQAQNGPNSQAPPPLFTYCRDDATLDIVFPDWSFWGWPELNIKPWETLSKDLKEGNKRSRWVEREPLAYWKGNHAVAPNRLDMAKCNVSDKRDWNARIYSQDWIREQQQGYKQSDLASQCTHRYKIYIEGVGWSVSEKYILACDSVTLLVKPRYYDFFARSLMPLQHYWPIRNDDKCRSLKHAVDWGNTHPQEAQAIGKAASSFIQEELKMDYVYDYMFHLLSEYAKLLKFKPGVPRKAIEVCSEFMACPAQGLWKQMMTETFVRGPSDAPPCAMPPPYDPQTLHSILERKENSMKQVETLEKQYWDGRNEHK